MKKISIEGNRFSGKTYYLQLLEKDGYKVNESVQICENSPYTLKHIHDNQTVQIDWMPDVMIYLFCHPITCHQRSQSTVNLDYLNQLHTKYEIICDQLNNPVEIYKVNAHEDPETVYQNIKNIIDQVIC